MTAAASLLLPPLLEQLLNPVQVHWSAIVRLVVMAAIVATLWCPPAAALIWLGSALSGVSIHTVATFGERMHASLGLVVWWLVLFLPAIGYSAVFVPSWEKDAPPL